MRIFSRREGRGSLECVWSHVDPRTRAAEPVLGGSEAGPAPPGCTALLLIYSFSVAA